MQGYFYLLEKIYVKQPTEWGLNFKNLDWVFFAFSYVLCAHNKVAKRLALVSIAVEYAFRSDCGEQFPAQKQTPLSACLKLVTY